MLETTKERYVIRVMMMEVEMMNDGDDEYIKGPTPPLEEHHTSLEP